MMTQLSTAALPAASDTIGGLELRDSGSGP